MSTTPPPTEKQIEHAIRKVDKIHNSAWNYINRQGGNYTTKRWENLYDQWDRITELPGFKEACERLYGHKDGINLGDLSC